jgi:hypothetical protein
MAVRLSALRAGRPLLPRRFLVLISVKRLRRHQGHSAGGRIRWIEKSNDLIGNRTRDLPASSIVPQPTALWISQNNTVRSHCIWAIIFHFTSIVIRWITDVISVGADITGQGACYIRHDCLQKLRTARRYMPSWYNHLLHAITISYRTVFSVATVLNTVSLNNSSQILWPRDRRITWP